MTPFEVYVRIVPQWGSGELKPKRFEMIRDMQKTAYLAYNALSSESDIELCHPGGGQVGPGGGQEYGSFSTYKHGVAVKPRIGQAPAQLIISGFYNTSRDPEQQHPQKMVFHCGEAVSGPGGSVAAIANPVTGNRNDQQAIKTIVENALSSGLPSSVEYEIFRMVVAGVTYGDGGYHL